MSDNVFEEYLDKDKLRINEKVLFRKMTCIKFFSYCNLEYRY